MSRERRRAENEAAFRAVNERIARLGRRYGSESLELVCECSDADCSERVSLTVAEYERARAEPTYFLVVPGHETAGIERVVERGRDFAIVEKGGEAAEVAAATDPRTA
jgi:hypothetical protein